VPLDESNTCYKITQRMLKATEASGKVFIEIEKHLPIQGGMGAASSNAVAAMLGLERAIGIKLDQVEKLRIAAEVGSDLPLFLIGGTVLGVGRGEEVYALPDLPKLELAVVTPLVGISTPRAFGQWDELVTRSEPAQLKIVSDDDNPALTGLRFASTINQSGQAVLDWLAENIPQAEMGPASGVPAVGGDRAETPLLDLVRTGIENDFERVVFPEYPELREVKELLQRGGARWASLSGSGSTVYGVFAETDAALEAAERMKAAGHVAVATASIGREAYWNAIGRSIES
jgi:4-diphosphocytidyl-2-C-methyl-D-erythritol kinase